MRIRKIVGVLGALMLLVSVMIAVPAVAAGTVEVNQDNLGVDWFSGPPADTRAGGNVQFVNGPATPPLGTGSVEFTTTDTAPDSSQAKAQLFTYQFGSLAGAGGAAGTGLALADVTELSYWAYKSSASTNSAAQTLGLNIEVDYVGDGSSFTTLVYEPVYQTGGVGAIATDTWQQWDAFDSGNAIWWSTNTIPGAPAFTYASTWNDIVTNNPNAEVKFGFGFNVGSGWAGEYSGNGDALALGILGDTTTYNFELKPAAPPGPTPDVTGPYTVVTNAVVGTTGGGGLNPPVIECKWELVDMNRAFLGDSQADDGDSIFFDEATRQAGSPDFPKVGQLPEYWMDYAWQDPSSNWWYDDDPANTSGFVCLANAVGDAEQSDGARHLIQVYANAGDATDPGVDGVFGTTDDVNHGSALDPVGERLIELWAAVDPPGADLSDIQQVYWDVYHPDGTKKAQVHDKVGYGADECRDGYTNFLGAGEAVPFDPTSFGIASENTVMGAAHGSGQVHIEAVEAIISSCAQQQKKLYQSHFTLSKHQPCGEYEVVAHAIPVIGPEDVLTNYFDVLCFIHLDLDYASVSWTDANTTGWAFYEGDFDMETPSLPTAINAGSGPLTVVVEFFPMESQTDLNGNPLSGKWLEDFDVSFGVSEASLTPLLDENDGDALINTDQNDPTAGVSTLMDDSPGTTLCTNEPGKFIYSLHTDAALPGNYAGTLNVSAVISDLEVCNNTKTNGLGGMGVWGGYHDLGADGAEDGGGAAGAPVSIGNFDDDYGRNQRSVVNP